MQDSRNPSTPDSSQMAGKLSAKQAHSMAIAVFPRPCFITFRLASTYSPIAGTAGAQDLFTDAWCIATLGIAGAQVIDMYRYYKQLITPAGQVVTYTADEIEKLHGIGAFYSPIDFATVGMVQSYVQNDVRLVKLPNFLTDAELALTGDAGGQVVDLINWWFKITTTARREGVFACAA
jgi:hypothetical protein